MSDQLSCIEQAGSQNINTKPVVFLHGFGGMAAQWNELQTEISEHAPTLAYDLPGHSGSLNFPNAGPAKVAAKAIIADLNQRGIAQARFVGHSMGGAIAGLIALFNPALVASLTLLAPGGFGPQINIEVLKKWASAQSEAELRDVIPNFFATDYRLPDAYVELHTKARQVKGANQALIGIADNMTTNGEQGQLPVDDILVKNIPTSLIWGDSDAIIPVSQALPLKDKVALHILNGVGHSPAEESYEVVKKVLLDQVK